MSSFNNGAMSGRPGITHVPAAGGSKLRSNRSSMRRTSEVEVNRIPLERRFVTLNMSIYRRMWTDLGDLHLSESDWIGLDGCNAQSVY